MLTSNSRLTGKIAKILRHVPRSQRYAAVLGLREQYKVNPELMNESLEKLFITGNKHNNQAPAEIPVDAFDTEMSELVNRELQRQVKSIDLIASSGIGVPGMSEFTMCLGNKSSPGYPTGRFFAGDTIIDEIERLCYKRALNAFKLDSEEWGVNVQTLSGSLANLATFTALCEPGETILALCSKSGGGHHTYGLKDTQNKGINLYSKMWNFEYYYVDSESHIDYDQVYQKAMELKPKLIIAGASSYPRDIDYARFRKICDESGALMLADIAHGFGLSISGAVASPFPYADVVTASASKSMRGPRAGLIYSKKALSKQIDSAVFPGTLGAPQNNIIGSLATAFKYCESPQFKEYAFRCVDNARSIASELQRLGNKIVTDGTDTNILMWDIKSHKINAKTLTNLGDAVNIQFNGVTLPNDVGYSVGGQGGVRFGTNGITARGYTPEDCKEVARYLNEVAIIGAKVESSDAAVWTESLRVRELGEEVEKFASSFPMPGLNSQHIF